MQGANGVRVVMSRTAQFSTGDEAEPSLLQARMSMAGRLLQVPVSTIRKQKVHAPPTVLHCRKLYLLLDTQALTYSAAAA